MDDQRRKEVLKVLVVTDDKVKNLLKMKGRDCKTEDEQTGSPDRRRQARQRMRDRKAFEEKVQCASVGPVDKNRKSSLAHRGPLCSFVSHSRKGTAVNSRDQSIRPRGARAPVLTVYPERNGKLESSINRTVR